MEPVAMVMPSSGMVTEYFWFMLFVLGGRDARDGYGWLVEKMDSGLLAGVVVFLCPERCASSVRFIPRGGSPNVRHAFVLRGAAAKNQGAP
jgi:hypothetical protein